MTHSDKHGVLVAILCTVAGAAGVLIGQVQAPPAFSPEEEAANEREEEHSIVEGFREENGAWAETVAEKRQDADEAEEVCREKEKPQ